MADRLEPKPPSCYKFEIPKTIEQWLLFEYVGFELAVIQAMQNEGTGRESPREYPSICVKDWARCDSDKTVD